MKKEISFILFVLQILISDFMVGQNQHRVDSLLDLLSNTTEVSIKCDIYRQLYKEYSRTDIEKASWYINQELELARKSDYTLGIAHGLYNASAILRMKGKYDSALIMNSQAQEYFVQMSDTIAYADCLSEAGNLYLQKKDFKNSFIQLMEALRVYRTTSKKDNLAHIYNRLGSMYLAQNQYDSTLKYYTLSLEINEKNGFKLGSSVNLLNIGNVYEKQQDFTKAIDFYQKAFVIKEQLNDKMGMLKCMINIGNSYNSIKDIKSAISFHENALAIAQGFRSTLEIAICYINLGNDYLKDNSFSKAEFYASDGHCLARQINDLELLKESSRILAESNEELKKYPEAYRYYKLYKLFSDSIVKQNNLTELAEVQAKYENVKRENEIATLKINKERQELKIQTLKGRYNLFIGLFIALLVTAFFFYYRSLNSKKISDKLREINDMKSRFFANLSHEFRTPLTLMLGPADKLLQNAKPEDKPWLELIIRNARRLLFLDEQLLEFTKIDSGSQVLHLVEGDILLPLKAITASFEILAEKNRINFTRNFPDEAITTIFDADILEKTATNILSNAFKYTTGGGNVSITVGRCELEIPVIDPGKGNKPKSEFLRIDVSDTGIGIPENMKEKIFERFYRLNNPTGAPVEGTGIGLALTKELLNLHHGQVWVESFPGKGSIFSILLPLERQVFSPTELNDIKKYIPISDHAVKVKIEPIKENFPVENPPSDNLSNESKSNSPQILIVDDNDDMRMYLSEIVQQYFQVKVAKDGGEGFEVASNSLPDLIITDIMMQPVDGIEFCRQLKTDQRTSHIPVVMLTALSGVEEKIKGLETGADDYVTKPFKNQELLARINNLILQRKNLRELFTTTIKIEPKDITLTSFDEKFLRKLIHLVETNIDNSEMEVDFLVRSIGMSRSQLHRKITALTGQPISGFIRIIRIRRAAQLIEQGFGNVSEIMHEVGFSNLSYFSKCFKDEFNMTPSEFMAK